MKVGFFPNMGKEDVLSVMQQAVSVCTKLGMDVYLPEDANEGDVLSAIGVAKDHILPRNELYEIIEIAFSFGGDGTIIHLAKDVIDYDILVCGVNLGELGFLNQIELRNLQSRMLRIFKGDYFVEERTLLEGYIQSPRGRRSIPLAMNDITITRVEAGKMARINLAIDGYEVQQYPADGLIVATSTGSSGYNLSAGGPILAPDNHSIVVTPVCPHLLQSVSLTLRPNSTVKITMPQREHSLIASVDGTFNGEFFNDEELHIQAYGKLSRFIRFHDQRFFGTLFKKLNARREMLL